MPGWPRSPLCHSMPSQTMPSQTRPSQHQRSRRQVWPLHHRHRSRRPRRTRLWIGHLKRPTLSRRLSAKRSPPPRPQGCRCSRRPRISRSPCVCSDYRIRPTSHRRRNPPYQHHPGRQLLRRRRQLLNPPVQLLCPRVRIRRSRRRIKARSPAIHPAMFSLRLPKRKNPPPPVKIGPSHSERSPDLQPAVQPGAPLASAVTPHWSDTAVWQAPELGSVLDTPERTEAAHANLPLAAQEAHLLPAEMPRTSASSEILLHLTDNDQSSAAIRVAERAGTVSVSVHAADPVLRESLRSNLGELSTQLNNQGWKADVIKSAAVAAQSGSQQDSHAGDQRGSEQQQSLGGDRQPQRDRRSNGGRWQQELDQQISGGDAHSGGNG